MVLSIALATSVTLRCTVANLAMYVSATFLWNLLFDFCITACALAGIAETKGWKELPNAKDDRGMTALLGSVATDNDCRSLRAKDGIPS